MGSGLAGPVWYLWALSSVEQPGILPCSLQALWGSQSLFISVQDSLLPLYPDDFCHSLRLLAGREISDPRSP